MKRIIILLLALLLALSLAACGGEKKTGASTGSDLSWAEIERRAEEELKQEQAQAQK